MDKEKIILLIVGAIIGFLVSLAKDWLMEGKKQKEKEKQLKRERLEELYIGFAKWKVHIISNEITLLSVMKNNLTFNQYLDLKIEQKTEFDAQRNEMILEVYAKELLPIHKEIIEQLTYLNQIENDFKEIYNSNGPHDTNKDFIEGNQQFASKFIILSDLFKAKLINEMEKVK